MVTRSSLSQTFTRDVIKGLAVAKGEFHRRDIFIRHFLLSLQNYVEHLISEKSGGGIDPSGRTIHRALVYTERMADTAEARNQVHAAA